MKASIKRIDKSLPLPMYETRESAGFDFVCRETVRIPSKEYKIIPSNNIIEPPKGHFLAILPRSSTFRKKGLIAPHGLGVSDRDYSGPEDEIGLLFYNITQRDVVVKRGEKIAQGLFLPVTQVEWREVQEIRVQSRGGFGSTD